MVGEGGGMGKGQPMGGSKDEQSGCLQIANGSLRFRNSRPAAHRNSPDLIRSAMIKHSAAGKVINSEQPKKRRKRRRRAAAVPALAFDGKSPNIRRCALYASIYGMPHMPLA